MASFFLIFRYGYQLSTCFDETLFKLFVGIEELELLQSVRIVWLVSEQHQIKRKNDMICFVSTLEIYLNRYLKTSITSFFHLIWWRGDF